MRLDSGSLTACPRRTAPGSEKPQDPALWVGKARSGVPVELQKSGSESLVPQMSQSRFWGPLATDIPEKLRTGGDPRADSGLGGPKGKGNGEGSSWLPQGRSVGGLG